jgi:DNA-binding helix-hairpin-helix protein with protein kinase domain
MPTVTQATQLFTDDGRALRLVKQIASSGEGVVSETDRPGYLAKVYHQPTPERIAKLRVMIANPPHDPMLRQNHISFAWPKELLRNPKGDYVGFLMPAINDSVKLSSIYNPRLRNRKAPRFNWYYLHATALNVASVIESIHAKGYVVGDIKPQNLLVNNRALVSVIDTDSFQIIDPQTNQLYRCLVGSEGFTPPELMGRELGKLDQSEVHDRYRLGVLIYLLLFGDHPFKGKWVGVGDAPNPVELARRGYWPFGPGSLIQPGPNTVPLDVVHEDLQRAFHQCFTNGHTQPDQRPAASDWSNALRASIGNLKVCALQTNHYYSRNQLHCYWCERKQRLGVDIFDTKLLQQTGKHKPKSVIQKLSTARVATARAWKPSMAAVQPQRQRSSMLQRYRREMAAGMAFCMAFICLIMLIGPDWSSIYPQLRQMLKSINIKSQEPSAPQQQRLAGNRIAADFSPPAIAATPGTHPSVAHTGIAEATLLALDPTGEQLAIGAADGKIQVWDLHNRRVITTLVSERAPIFALAFGDNGQKVIATSASGTVQVWHLSQGTPPALIEPTAAHTAVDTPHAIAISADGQWLATSGWDQQLLLRNLNTGQTQILGKSPSGDPVLTFAADGQYLASSEPTGATRLWQVPTGRLHSHSQPPSVEEALTQAVALSPNAQLLARGSLNGDIMLWDLTSSRPGKTLSGQSFQKISSLAISANNLYLVSGGADQDLRLWDLASGRLIQQLRGHQAPIRTLTLSANSQILATSSEDRTIKLWSIPDGALLQTLQ